MPRRRWVHTHSRLLSAAFKALDDGKVESGSYYEHMTAIIFSAFAAEAYLNYLGAHLVEAWGCLERLSFENKLRFLATELGVEIDFGKRPTQTVKETMRYRNELAHGRFALLIDDARPELCGRHPLDNLPEEWWERRTTREMAERSFEDVMVFASVLHARARDLRPELDLPREPFSGDMARNW